jgi:hypothetical protein
MFGRELLMCLDFQEIISMERGISGVIGKMIRTYKSFSNKSMLRRIFQAESSARNFAKGEGISVRLELPGRNFRRVYFMWEEISTEQFPVRGGNFLWRVSQIFQHYLKMIRNQLKNTSFFPTESKEQH